MEVDSWYGSVPKEELENWAMYFSRQPTLPPMETCVVPSDDQGARTCAELSRWPDLDPQGDTSPCVRWTGRRRSAPDLGAEPAGGPHGEESNCLRRLVNYCDQTH